MLISKGNIKLFSPLEQNIINTEGTFVIIPKIYGLLYKSSWYNITSYEKIKKDNLHAHQS